MDDITRRVLRAQQAALLSALGAFDALAIVGAHRHLPGYVRCKKEIEDAVVEAEQLLRSDPSQPPSESTPIRG